MKEKEYRPRMSPEEYEMFQILKGKIKEFGIARDKPILIQSTGQDHVPVKPKQNKFTEPGLYLLLGCVHAPGHNISMMNGITNLLIDYKDQLRGFVLMGDFLDMNTLSSHDTGRFTALPGLTLTEEYEIGEKLLGQLTEPLNESVDKIFLYGNHESRFNKYMEDMESAKRPLPSPIEGLKLAEKNFNVYTNWKDDHVTLGKHLDIFHGQFFNVHCAKKHIDTYRGSVAFVHCFSEDTEVLTKDGWKFFPELNLANDIVATINLETKALEYQPINGFHSYDHYKELIHFYAHGMDLMVTDKHAMIQLTKGGKLKRVEADELEKKSWWDTINGPENTQKDYKKWSDDELKLIGWVLTDGNYCSGAAKNNQKYIRIKQCDKLKVGHKHITDILDKLEQPYTVSQVKNSVNYECFDIYLKTSPLTLRIIENFPEKKMSWDLLKLSKRQFDLLKHEMLLADGCYNKDSIHSSQYVSRHTSDKDIMQALCVQNGYRSSATFRQNSYWTVTINTRKNTTVMPPERIAYSGNVYCIEVDNQTLLVRRNGRTSVAGNTHRIQTYIEGNTGGFNIGWGGDVTHPFFNYMPRGTKSMWQNGFAMVQIDEYGNYYLEQVIHYNGRFYYGGKKYN